jgi:hypothetical protein
MHRNISRLSQVDFTRNRKLKFEDIVALILNMMCKTLQIEIDDFISRFLSNKEITCTKQAFSKSRQKLSPRAFSSLSDKLIQNYYNDDDFKKYKNWRLLAIDGSILEIPNNPETQLHYGYAENKIPAVKVARAKMSELYDLQNGLSISAKIDHYKIGERQLAKENIEKMLTFKHTSVKNLILFDRGYPSLDLIDFLEQRNIDFLMRVPGYFMEKEIQNANKDEEIEIIIDKNRKRALAKHGKTRECIKFRVIKFNLSTTEEEILITNLSKQQLSIEEAKELYAKRWGIETRFDTLKNRLEIENFSGEKPLCIEQDFYASQFVSNLAAIFKNDAQEELSETNKKKNLKYDYAINNNILFGKLKNYLIELLLEENEIKKLLMYNDFIKQIQKNTVPIRKNRQFERRKKFKSNKYSKSTKRAI